MDRQNGTPPGPKFSGDDKRDRYTPQSKDATPKTRSDNPSPDNRTVEAFHRTVSRDTRPEDIHHTLGNDPNRASPGNHKHDGSDAPLILEGYTISGVKATPSTVLPSIIAALVRLGATDATT